MRYDVVKVGLRAPWGDEVLKVETCPDRATAMALARTWGLDDAAEIRADRIRVKVVETP